MPRPLQFLLNGVDISGSVVEAVVEKQEKRGADMCHFKVRRGVSVNVNDDFKVKEVAGGSFIFGGKVDEVSREYDVTECVALSYGKVFDEIRVFPARVYVNLSPEVIVNFLRSLYFNDFTLISGTSGVTIQRYEASGTISENLKILADIAGFDFWTEVSSTGAKQLYFRPANVNLNKNLYLGKVGANLPNAYRDSFEVDDSQIYNAVEVYGRSKSENVGYRWDTTYGYYTIYFARTLSSLGVILKGAWLKDGVDYVYNIDGKYVAFLTSYSATSTNPTTIEIEGVADNTPLAYGEDSDSIATYGRRCAAVILDKEINQNDLNNFVAKFLQLYSSPRTTLKVRKPGLDFGIRNGGYVRVYDPYLGINGDNYVVRVVRWKYPEGVTEMLLSSFEPELYDFQRGVAFKVESASRSYVQSRDIGIVEKKFYFSGSGTTFGLVEQPSGVVSGNSSYTASNIENLIRLRLIVARSDNTVIREYNSIDTAPLFIPIVTDGVVRLYYSSPFDLVSDPAGPDNVIKLRAQLYIRSIGNTSQFLLAPLWNDSTKFFEVSLSNVSRILRTTIGYNLYVSRASDYTVTVYWGFDRPSYLFGFGFKLA